MAEPSPERESELSDAFADVAETDSAGSGDHSASSALPSRGKLAPKVKYRKKMRDLRQLTKGHLHLKALYRRSWLSDELAKCSPPESPTPAPSRLESCTLSLSSPLPVSREPHATISEGESSVDDMRTEISSFNTQWWRNLRRDLIPLTKSYKGCLSSMWDLPNTGETQMGHHGGGWDPIRRGRRRGFITSGVSLPQPETVNVYVQTCSSESNTDEETEIRRSPSQIILPSPSSSQQYTNPAYEAEDSQPELREIESKRDSSTIRDQETNGEPVVQNHEPPRIPTISISKRQSIADIAFTQVKSSSVNREFRASSFIRQQLERNRSKFVHPFGNKSTILEILYGGGDEDDLGQAEVEAGSAAKLVIWLVFCCFMIGVAGAIILGAESFAKKLDINNSTLVITSTSASFHADST